MILIRGQRSTPSRIAQGFVTPTLKATPGDLSLVIPKRQLDDIIEMIYALVKYVHQQLVMTHYYMVLKLNSTTCK